MKIVAIKHSGFQSTLIASLNSLTATAAVPADDHVDKLAKLQWATSTCQFHLHTFLLWENYQPALTNSLLTLAPEFVFLTNPQQCDSR